MPKANKPQKLTRSQYLPSNFQINFENKPKQSPLTKMSVQAIKDTFANRVDMDKEYTLAELKQILGDVYKEITDADKQAKKAAKAAKAEKPAKAAKAAKPKRQARERDENGQIIKKRPPSEYNIYISEQSAIIKQQNPTFDSKTVFKMAVEAWKQRKTTDKTENIEPTVPSGEPSEPGEPSESGEPSEPGEPVVEPSQSAQAAQAAQAESMAQEAKKPPKKLAKKPKRAQEDDD